MQFTAPLQPQPDDHEVVTKGFLREVMFQHDILIGDMFNQLMNEITELKKDIKDFRNETDANFAVLRRRQNNNEVVLEKHDRRLERIEQQLAN